jgi:hypothetical protein
MFGPKVEFIQPDADPLQSPSHRRKRKPWLVILLSVGLLSCCLIGGFGLARSTFAKPPDPTEPPPPTATLPAPAVRVTDPQAALQTALAPIGAALTPSAAPSASKTPIVLWSNTPTPPEECENPQHFLTELACNDIGTTATLASLAPGTVVNLAGVDPRVTIIYLYPSQTASPWIITTTASWTPYPTYTPFPSHTFTPYPTYTRYPTYTPWILMTAPPLVTVEVTREVTVIVTATFTDTPTPSETPAPSETPTETPTP